MWTKGAGMAVAMAALTLTGVARAAETAASSKIDQVTVYPDGATVVRVIEVDLPAGVSSVLTRDLPVTADRSTVRVEGEAKGPVEIGSVEVTAPQPGDEPRREEAEIRNLEDEIAELDDGVLAAAMRLKYLEAVAGGAPGKQTTAPSDADLKRTAAAIAEETAAAAKAKREAGLAKREPERRLAALRAAAAARPPARLEVRINVAARQAGHATLRLSYSVSGASWRPAYDASLTTGVKPQLRLSRRAEVSQATGEDWTDVALSVSTLRMSRGTAPAVLPPLLARYRQVRPVAAAPAMAPGISAMRAAMTQGPAEDVAQSLLGSGTSTMSNVAAQAALPVAMQELQATAENVGLDVSYRVAGRSAVPSDRTMRSFVLASADLSPDVALESVPEIDEQAFVEASWRHDEDAPLLAGQATLRRDGIFVGRGRMAAARKGEPVRLGFGVDENVRVKRDLVRRGGATPGGGITGFMASSRTEEKNWTYTIHNGRDQAVKVRVLDRVPVSEADEIKVEELQVPQAPVENDVDGRRGVRAWTFEVRPRSDLQASFGWRVSWPKDRDAAVE